MKIRYVMGIFAVFLLLALSGCGGKGEVVVPESEESDEDFGGGEAEADSEDSELTDEEKKLSNKELLKKLQEEAGLDSGEDAATTNNTSNPTESETSGGVKEVTIQNFKGTPDDFTIDVGTTVRWTNFMNNFKQLIVILPWDEDKGKYDFKEINELEQILYNESYEYTFEEAGDFKWGSKTRFDKIHGEIKVK